MNFKYCDSDFADIAAFLRYLLAQYGLNATEFAEELRRVGYPGATKGRNLANWVQQWVRGRRKPPFDALQYIAKVFAVTDEEQEHIFEQLRIVLYVTILSAISDPDIQEDRAIGQSISRVLAGSIPLDRPTVSHSPSVSNECEPDMGMAAHIWVRPAAGLLRRTRLSVVPVPSGIDEFREGECLHIGYGTNYDAYMYIFVFNTLGQAVQLLPSRKWPDNKIQGGQSNFIPQGQDRTNLVVHGPSGMVTLIALATAQRIDVFDEWQTALPSPCLYLSARDFDRANKFLTECIARSQWAVGEYQYYILGGIPLLRKFFPRRQDWQL